MKFQLNKFASVLAVAGLVMGLAACGSGDDTVPVAQDLTPIEINVSSVAIAQAIAAELVTAGATFELKTSLPATLNKLPVTLPAGTLKLVKTTSSDPKALADFTLGSAKGILIVGSCVFKFTDATGTGFTVGDEIVITPCSLDLETGNKSANGVSQSATVSFVFGGTKVDSSAPINNVTLTPNASGGVDVKVAGVPAGTVAPVTGTGATGVRN